MAALSALAMVLAVSFEDAAHAALTPIKPPAAPAKQAKKPASVGPSAPANTATRSQTASSRTFSFSLSSLDHLRFVPNATNTDANGESSSASPIVALPLNAPPVNGFIPRVVFGLTEEDKPDDFDWYTAPAGPISNTALPSAAAPKYFSAIYDTGSQTHLLTYDTAAALGFTPTHLSGDPDVQQVIVGAAGPDHPEYGVASDALGVYATGFTSITSGANGNVSVAANSLRGHYNSSVVVLDNPKSALPNIIGAPMTSLYQTVINNSKTTHRTIGADTFKSPEVKFQAQGTALPAGYSRLTLSAVPSGSFTDPPSFIPNFNTFDHDNPQTATFWASLLCNVTVSHTDGSDSTQFLFDTGAEVSVVSEDTANQMGIFLPDPVTHVGGTTPDFYEDITGVGTDGLPPVPGYYINQLKFTTSGGFFTYTHVPVLVINLPDPRDPVHQTLPGVLGMNLFTDRDMIIDTSGTPYAAFGPQITPQWTGTGGGTWLDDAKWSLGSPDGADVPANFLSSITTDATINVDPAGFTVGSMKFDNAHRYTIAGPGTITMAARSIGTSLIDVVSGSHTISAPVVLQSNTTINVTPAASVLTMSGDVNGGTITIGKTGAGAVAMKNVRAGTLSISAGTVSILSNGTNIGASKIAGLTIAGGATPAGTLDLNNNDLIIKGGTSKSTVEGLIRYAYDFGLRDRRGITSSTARTNPSGNTTLGVLSGQEYFNNNGSGTFDGFTVGASDVLVKYTYYGDVDFNGAIDSTDYNLIDFGFLTGASGWANGDVDLSGAVDSTDYNLIDFAFVTQNGVLRRAISYLDGADRSTRGMTTDASLQEVMKHFDEFGNAYAQGFLSNVPEPTLSAIGIAMIGATFANKRARRRSRSRLLNF